jgi:hypothetical protein
MNLIHATESGEFTLTESLQLGEWKQQQDGDRKAAGEHDCTGTTQRLAESRNGV